MEDGGMMMLGRKANVGSTHLSSCTYLIKSQGLPEYPDRLIGSYERERSTTKDPDTRNGVPARQQSHSKLGA